MYYSCVFSLCACVSRHTESGKAIEMLYPRGFLLFKYTIPAEISAEGAGKRNPTRFYFL